MREVAECNKLINPYASAFSYNRGESLRILKHEINKNNERDGLYEK